MTPSVIKVGTDVHKNSLTAAAYDAVSREMIDVREVDRSRTHVKDYADGLKETFGDDAEIECGCEAGGFDYALQWDLENLNVPRVILTPTEKENGARDAETIARCLADRSYSGYALTLEDEAVRDYTIMRDDLFEPLVQIKQRVRTFCLEKGKHCGDQKNCWSRKHLDWLRTVELPPHARWILDEYLQALDSYVKTIARLGKEVDDLR